MRTDSCDRIRDVLPDWLHGGLDEAAVSHVESHIALCADCTREAELLEVLRAAPVIVPLGLERRVLSAVRRPRPLPRWSPARVAMAATVAAAVIGGSLVLQQGREASPDGMAVTPATVAIEEYSGSTWGWLEDDPLAHGSSALQELSEEELQLLLAELES